MKFTTENVGIESHASSLKEEFEKKIALAKRNVVKDDEDASDILEYLLEDSEFNVVKPLLSVEDFAFVLELKNRSVKYLESKFINKISTLNFDEDESKLKQGLSGAREITRRLKILEFYSLLDQKESNFLIQANEKMLAIESEYILTN